MRDYLFTSNSFKIKSISNKDFCKFSFCPKDYRTLSITNINTIQLSKICKRMYKGGEIGTDSYMKKSIYRFLKTVNISSKLTTDTSSIEFCMPNKLSKPKLGDILIVKDGAGDGLGEVAYYNIKNNKTDSISAGLLGIEIEEQNRYYVLGILKSKHFKSFIDINTAQGSTIRHSKLVALDYPISFPSIKNYPTPDLIEEYVSLIVQNIIDKEEQVESKNKEIDLEIENELLTNSNGQSFIMSNPKISIIRTGNRFDTSVYSESYKRAEHLITSYNNGYYHINEKKVSPGKTPDDYFFSETKRNSKFSFWITPKNVFRRQLLYQTFIHTKATTKIKRNTIILNGIRYVGNGIFIDNDEKHYANQNTLLIDNFKDQNKQLILFCFLTSNLGRFMQTAQRNFGIVPILYKENLCKIPIPDFTPEIEISIIKKYYNVVDKIINLSLEDYLVKQKERNKMLGIHQLNNEIFILRDKLNDIISDIINDRPIEINLNY